MESSDEPYVTELRRVYARLNRELWVLNITSDFGIPVFAAVSRRMDQPTEDIIYGFGAHFDYRVALLSALKEVNQMLVPVTTPRRDGKSGYNYNDNCAIEWWRTATLREYPYLMGYGIVSPGSVSDRPAEYGDVKTCGDLVKRHGMEMLLLDLTRPDIGLPVAKVVVPGMRHFWERFAPGRLYDVPVRMGWLDHTRREQELNSFPVFV